MREVSDKKYSNFNIFPGFLYTITILTLLWFALDGWDFYSTSFSERPHHTDYRALRPGSERSHGFGVLGSIMLVTLLLYSIRKRTSLLGSRSKMKNWLNFHIFLGINGPLFIILHSTFKLNGIVAVSFWSMIAVALSGVVGRYLYLRIPRNITGHEMTLSDVQNMNENITNTLRTTFHLNLEEIAKIEQELTGKTENIRNLFSIFFSMMFRDILIRVKSFTRRKKIEKRYKIPHSEIKELIKLAGQKAVLEQRILFWNRIQQLFHYWHIFHKPFAVIMYLIMIVHIGVSIWLGYTWIF